MRLDFVLHSYRSSRPRHDLSDLRDSPIFIILSCLASGTRFLAEFLWSLADTHKSSDSERF